ncbi:hypothetical protein DPMN_070725 [Dreissena polymorpha]|uniref:Uncharacterized protein n=1 Tax=Dreissena polymorpha TaxID=45954 RepID=A0A9D3Z1V9_DREPO|nr:hypothetical protein DPMN_070725 [Dreissena polymorpha]
MQRPVCTPLGKGTPVPAGRGKSWSHLSLCLFCLGCDRTITMGAAAKEEKSGRSVVPGTSRLCAKEPTSIGLRLDVSGCWPSSSRSGSVILLYVRVQPDDPS